MEYGMQLWFTSPKELEVRKVEEKIELKENEVIVETIVSAISPGTEMKVYRGQFHSDLNESQLNSAHSDSFNFPTKYGYSLVGRIVQIGHEVESNKKASIGDIVFSFHPHEERFVSKVEDLIFVPKDISPEDAVLLPNVETAVNFLHDGHPLLGDKIAVFGQGIVGLLTTFLVSQIPFTQVLTFDLIEDRRKLSLSLGATASFDPSDKTLMEKIKEYIPNGTDVTYEISGSSHALSQAIQVTGYNSKVVIGSWYGNNTLNLQLGNAFHRSHMNIIASQVSRIRPELSGRWNKQRRFDVAWDIIRKLKPSKFITHRFPITDAKLAYKMLDESPQQCIQVIFMYEKKK